MAKPKLTEAMARAAGEDAANRQMRAAGRTAWSAEDYSLAVAEFNRLYPDPHAGCGKFRLVNRESGSGDQTPPILMVTCPQCRGKDEYCTYCGGVFEVPASSAIEWCRQNEE